MGIKLIKTCGIILILFSVVGLSYHQRTTNIQIDTIVYIVIIFLGSMLFWKQRRKYSVNYTHILKEFKMATNIDVTIGTGALVYTADPSWLDDDNIERPVESVVWFSSDPGVLVSGDMDIGEITIPDISIFTPGQQALVSVTADAKFGEDVAPIVLEAIFTFLAPETPQATHGELAVTLKP
jgi:hypothetical protein